jgi:hypothetical protein
VSPRESELQQLDVTLAGLAEPWDQPLAVMPTWVRQQLQDLAGLLSGSPERARVEFQRLGLTVTRVQPNGAA